MCCCSFAKWLIRIVGDENRITLLESWGYTVTLIDDGASLADIELAAKDAAVAYLSATVDAGALMADLANLPIGIISEKAGLLGEIGVASAFGEYSLNGIEVTDVGHYITTDFVANTFAQLTKTNTSYHVLRGSVASQLQTLAAEPGPSAEPSLAVLEAGVLRQDGVASIARRVNMPWAANAADFDVFNLTTQGRTVLRRSLEWAAASAGRFPGYYDSFPTRTCSVAPDYFWVGG